MVGLHHRLYIKTVINVCLVQFGPCPNMEGEEFIYNTADGHQGANKTL